MRSVTKQYGNAIVTVVFADITPEERQRRIEHEVKPALARFGRAAIAAGVDLEAYSREKTARRQGGAICERSA